MIRGIVEDYYKYLKVANSDFGHFMSVYMQHIELQCP